ncbi:hypothetical protein M406DRAFT_72349 [Cryphonectria parasitica EP155]|uniref:Methyltransferase type 11 domain-containing protein n=1 Tax=Cryphonectria parasitica (strain ATCC 38755 / EP155) TaxID=660469 RepID=A0A9P4XW12_CRYP1|nr:uncharacterized protein M406DRAFT_72349 [Cryphonectria parasitica EP155]KAF3762337.1 hypothetical protein M406DRAFT_72349 [Cryphonectria parasitica EP155]
MSSTTVSAPLDPTFRNYTPEQAAAYARGRGESATDVIQETLAFHLAGGGSLEMALDVGCGTGQAARVLAPHFSRVVGVDPGAQMVEQARQAAGETRSGEPVEFEVLAAEELASSRIVQPGSVDLLTSAMAAHWFRMDEFWRQAARMVKPGGTVALWTHASLFCHPSTPNAAAVQEALSHLEDSILGPFEGPALHLSRTMYDTLPLPWSIEPPVAAFSAGNFVRKEWNRGGKLEDGAVDFFAGGREQSLDELAQGLDTASMVTRWRQAHPDCVGTEEDCVRVTVRRIAEVVGKDQADIRLKLGSATALLLFRRGPD